MTSRLLEQNSGDLANQTGVELLSVKLNQRLQTVQALGLDQFVNPVVEFGARRARPGGLFDRDGRSETHLGDQIERGREIRVRLTGKADDEIRRKGKIRARASDIFD